MIDKLVQRFNDLRKDGWTNFGKNELTDRELGFNDGVDAALKVLYKCLRKTEINSVMSFAEMSELTIASREQLEEVTKQKLSKDLAVLIAAEGIVDIETENDVATGQKKMRGIVYFVDPNL